ncbi:MAG: heparinase II/III family protein [Planctomycetaceae bacterium]|jgi:hypothetical protein|nr:heparinase II/III family protein [Planctomycetaceae bacterium]
MKYQNYAASFFVFWGITIAVFAQNEERFAQIEKRAEEIRAFLPEKARGVGSPIADREKWESLKNSFDVPAIIRTAEKVMASPIPETPESLYMDYYQTGNRVNYQKVHGRKYGRINSLVLGECFENQGRFLPAIEEAIRAVCDDPSWVLPAHDSSARIYKGEVVCVDLYSADFSWRLATVDYWLQEKLSPETRKLIRDNVERRTFAPYEKSIQGKKNGSRDNWWITTTNNWNAVCHAGVVGAALALIDDPARRAFYIAAAEKNSEYFLNGFTQDGYCSEGMGYWNYGFGHYVYMGEIVLQATGGKVDFFSPPIVRNVALFGSNMQIAPNVYAAYADCSPYAKPDSAIMKYMNRRLSLGLPDYEDSQFLRGRGETSLSLFGVMGFPNTATSRDIGETKTGFALRHEFADAGILIARATNNDPKRLSFSIKAGHNNEHHNHNDVGSYIVSLGGGTPLVDPGGEVYTSRTFSGKRYDSNVINSFGHSVPRINGILQQTGVKARGAIFEKSFTDAEDKIAMDLSSAYPVKGLQELTRTVFFNRTDDGRNGEKHAGGQLLILDHVALEDAGTFETALITFGNVVKITNADQAESIELLIGDNAKEAVRVTVSLRNEISPMTLKYELTEIDEDMSGSKVKPKRLAFSNVAPSKKADIVTVIVPAPTALIEKYFPTKKSEEEKN